MSDGANPLPQRLDRCRDNTQTTVETLAALRRRVEESAARLESPAAVLEFIDFFAGFFTEAAATLGRVRADLEAGPERAHAAALRQLASNAAVEQRRGLQFRDKWINRPLPYEDVRPLLTEISNHTGYRLTEFRDLNLAADEVDALLGPESAAPDEGRPLDRRQLFTKWFGK